MVLMKSTSLVSAKAHLSELVDDAEHRGKRILILRHGKPAAAIVPVEVAVPKRKRSGGASEAEALAALDRLCNEPGDPTFDAVADLRAGRERGPAR